MGVNVKIPHEFDVNLDVVKPVELAGIPTTYHVNLDHVNIDHIAKITLGIDPLKVEPLDISVRVKELPSIRGHIPANFSVGLFLLGFQLFCIRLCGEAQVITEPYVPNPCEKCGGVVQVQPNIGQFKHG